MNHLPACVLLCLAAFTALPAAANDDAEIDRVVRTVCGKEVVLIGEDAAHGSGQTFAIKVELIMRLVERCEFSAVAFESQIYDFLDLERASSAGTATPAQLLDAIGGFWSTTKEVEPLLPFLFERAASGKTRLLGLDPQVGGATQRYTQAQLARELSSYIGAGRRQACEAEIERLTSYRYDANHPYDDDTRRRLRACATEVEANAALTDAGTAAYAAQMAANLARYLEMSSGNAFNVRDRAMFDNLLWHRSRLGAANKVIIWCATTHAIKQPPAGSSERITLGAHVHRALGTRAAAIGFSALGGSYGRSNRPPTILTPATPGTLEARSLQDPTMAIAYLDVVQLQRLGPIEARAINYSQPITARWDQLLDGLIVLRQEHPPQHVRSAQPQ